MAEVTSEAINNESNFEEFGLENNSSGYLLAGADFPKLTKRLIALILIVSAIALMLLLGAFFGYKIVLFLYLSPFTRESIKSLGILFLISLILAAINQHYPHSFPIIINLPLDFILSVSLFLVSFRLFDVGLPTARWCMDDYYIPYSNSDCERTRDTIVLFLRIVGGLAMITGLAHLGLFCLWCITMSRSSFWTRPFPDTAAIYRSSRAN